MFHTKICGVRLASDVNCVARSGADAVGLNFFPPSVRYLDHQETTSADLSQLAKRLGLFRVGVFVNPTQRLIGEVLDSVGIDAVQLHGDESLVDASALSKAFKLPFLRAIKLPLGSLESKALQQAIAPWVDAGFHPLLDADAGASHGGSGKTLDWDSIGDWSQRSVGSDFTLAGGLNPNNVAEAMRRSGAKSVDTASGVENPRGVKNVDLIEAFTRAATTSRTLD